MVATMTAAEMAERIGRTGGARSTFTERIQYWSRAGLIVPEGEQFPGPGKHRRYSEKTFEDVLLLDAATNLGMSPGYFKGVLERADVVRKRDWKKRDFYITLEQRPHILPTPGDLELKRGWSDSAPPTIAFSAFTINVSGYFAFAKSTRPEHSDNP